MDVKNKTTSQNYGIIELIEIISDQKMALRACFEVKRSQRHLLTAIRKQSFANPY